MNSRINALEKKVFEFVRKPSAINPAASEPLPLFLANLPAKNDEEFIKINKRIDEFASDMDELVIKDHSKQLKQ